MNRRLDFSRIWRPPGRMADRSDDRRVTFLELFFDLVFVVIIAQLAHRLNEHATWSGVGWFVFFFFAVWTSWINGTFYYDLHATNDVSVRVFTFAQMLAVAVMAVFAADIPGDGSAGFALAYAANTLVLAVLWFRTGVHDPTHRPASNPYTAAYLVAALVFALSAAVDEPQRYWLWGVGLATQYVGLVVTVNRMSAATPPGQPAVTATPSLIERLGLFVIIVLGEVVVGAVTGMAEVRPEGSGAIAIGLLGVLVAIGAWWLYFDLVSHRTPSPMRTQLWLYLHLPMVMAIAAGGAGVLNTVAHATEPLPSGVRWLLVVSLAVVMVAITAITLVLEARTDHLMLYRAVGGAMLVSAALLLVAGLLSWSATATLGAMVILLLLPVGVGLFVVASGGHAEAASHA